LLIVKVNFAASENDEELLGHRSLGNLRRVNFDDREFFIEYLILRLGVLTEGYTSHPISNIEFSYLIKDGIAVNTKKHLEDVSETISTTHRFNNINLPITMDPSKYGTITLDNYIQIGGKSIHRFLVESGSRTYTIDVSNEGLTNKVKIHGIVDLQWTDTKINDELFSREIGKSIIYFLGGEKVLRKKVLNSKPFTRLSVDKKLNSNFITMDIETVTIDSKITPYLICAYNGSEYIHSYAD